MSGGRPISRDYKRSRHGGAGLDLGHYRDAPPGLRIWCGATVQARDLKALMPWIAYAFALEKAKLKKAA